MDIVFMQLIKYQYKKPPCGMECEFFGHKCRQKAETKRVYYLQMQAEKKMER